MHYRIMYNINCIDLMHTLREHVHVSFWNGRTSYTCYVTSVPLCIESTARRYARNTANIDQGQHNVEPLPCIIITSAFMLS